MQVSLTPRGFWPLVDGLALRGPRPVDGDADGRLLAEAVAPVHSTENVLALAKALECRDDGPGDIGGPFQPSHCERTLLGRGNVPILVHTSWLDANYAAGALERFAALPNPQLLIIGPWRHGGGRSVDPFGQGTTDASPAHLAQRKQLVDFISAHLLETAKASPIREIRYVRLGDGAWRTTSHWPPAGFPMRQWFLQDRGRLDIAPPNARRGS
ncbi:MAG: hypothetical protein U1G07_11355 [Verrucomicrobiota bacterium]